MKNAFWASGLFAAMALSAPVAWAQNAPQPASAPAPATVTVQVATATQLLQQPNVVLLDVRTPAEYAAGHLRGAQNLDFRAPNFAQQVTQLDTTKTYVLYCASGNRSSQASKLMQEQGFRKVANAGAFKTLKESGLKTE